MKCIVCDNNIEKSTIIYDLLKCDNCGLYMRKNMPTKECMRSLLNKFALSAINDHSKFVNRLNKAFDQVETIEKYTDKGYLFDVCCGLGIFMLAAKYNMWNIEGNDISLTSTVFARYMFNFNVYNDFFEDLELSSNKYNAVVFWNSLEHLLEPRKALEKAYNILKTGGIVHIRVPNSDKRNLEEKYEQLHIYEFNPSNLIYFLKSCGFKEVFVDTHDEELDVMFAK